MAALVFLVDRFAQRPLFPLSFSPFPFMEDLPAGLAELDGQNNWSEASTADGRVPQQCEQNVQIEGTQIPAFLLRLVWCAVTIRLWHVE
jgi:hypothetical protein